MEDAPPPDGVAEIFQRREAAQDEAVAAQEDRLFRQVDTGMAGATWRDLRGPVEEDPREHGGGEGVKRKLGAVFQGPRGQRKIFQEYFRRAGRDERPRPAQDRSPGRALLLHPLKVDGGARSRPGRFHRAPVDLQPTDARDRSAGEDLDLFPDADRSPHKGAGDDRPEPLHRERAIDGKAEEEGGVLSRDSAGDPVERGDQPGKPLPGRRGYAHDGRVLQEGPTDEFPDLLLLEGEPLLVDLVALVQGHEPVPDGEEAADVQVLPGLRHDPFVRGDHQHQDIHPGGPGDHRPDEFLVAGDVDDPRKGPGGEREVREPQLDRDPPLLLLLEAVGVDSRQGPDERALAVVDVARGSDDDPLGHEAYLTGFLRMR